MLPSRSAATFSNFRTSDRFYAVPPKPSHNVRCAERLGGKGRRKAGVSPQSQGEKGRRLALAQRERPGNPKTCLAQVAEGINSSSSNALASLRSAVSNPSVNQP